MRIYEGRVKEIRLDSTIGRAAWITCPTGAIPAAGQYILAHNLDDEFAELGVWLFPGKINADGFLALPPIPASWSPGTRLELWGPNGLGFKLPDRVQRLGLAALGDTIARLLPLIEAAVSFDCSVTLFSDAPLVQLLPSVEVYPLGLLPEALTWAEFMALDVPHARLPDLRAVLGIPSNHELPCPSQVLVFTSMPCSGLGDCGVCAVSARRGWKLVCRDGPVFPLETLDW